MVAFPVARLTPRSPPRLLSQQQRTSSGLTAVQEADGGVAGGLVGAVIAGLLSAGALAIPAAGLVVSGWLVSAAAGAGAGAADEEEGTLKTELDRLKAQMAEIESRLVTRTRK